MKRYFLSPGVVGAPPHTEDDAEAEAAAAARSLQVLVNYHRLYELWWRNPAHLSATNSSPETQMNGGASQSDSLDFDTSLLLSEPHAACQATQREVADIQERLSALMLQHSRANGGHLEAVDPAGETSEHQGSADKR